MIDSNLKHDSSIQLYNPYNNTTFFIKAFIASKAFIAISLHPPGNSKVEFSLQFCYTRKII